MMSASPHQPLMGFHWNEAEASDLFNHGLLTIIAFDLEGRPHVIGSGFVVSGDNTRAIGVSAAHVFSEIQRLQNPQPRHSPSTPAEFLPRPKPVNLEMKSVQAVIREGDRIEAAHIDGLVFDEKSDFAAFSIVFPNPAQGIDFPHHLLLDDTIPAEGDLVTILSFGNHGIQNYERSDDGTYRFQISRRPVVRVGRVLNRHPHGHGLCRGPCIVTSIPVYSGMSGGPVAIYASDGKIKVFGIVCSDPDYDDERKQDRSIEGRSTIALLPCKVTLEPDGRQKVELALHAINAAGSVVVLPH